jgi:REP element-mobilizing transposase RayT
MMGAPFTQLYLHLVWATWDRLSLVSDDLEQPLYAAIQAETTRLKCELLAVGGMPDHVHLLTRLHPAVSVAALVKQVKGVSSHLVTHSLKPGAFFKWQGAYGAFSLRKADAPVIQAYIERQKVHHASHDLRMEFEQAETVWHKPG